MAWRSGSKPWPGIGLSCTCAYSNSRRGTAAASLAGQGQMMIGRGSGDGSQRRRKTADSRARAGRGAQPRQVRTACLTSCPNPSPDDVIEGPAASRAYELATYWLEDAWRHGWGRQSRQTRQDQMRPGMARVKRPDIVKAMEPSKWAAGYVPERWSMPPGSGFDTQVTCALCAILQKWAAVRPAMQHAAK